MLNVAEIIHLHVSLSFPSSTIQSSTTTEAAGRYSVIPAQDMGQLEPGYTKNKKLAPLMVVVAIMVMMVVVIKLTP